MNESTKRPGRCRGAARWALLLATLLALIAHTALQDPEPPRRLRAPDRVEAPAPWPPISAPGGTAGRIEAGGLAGRSRAVKRPASGQSGPQRADGSGTVINPRRAAGRQAVAGETGGAARAGGSGRRPAGGRRARLLALERRLRGRLARGVGGLRLPDLSRLPAGLPDDPAQRVRQIQQLVRQAYTPNALGLELLLPRSIKINNPGSTTD